MNAYQKLKAENKGLKEELMILATKPDSVKGVTIKMKWRLLSDAEKGTWMGNSYEIPKKFNGFNHYIDTKP